MKFCCPTDSRTLFSVVMTAFALCSPSVVLASDEPADAAGLLYNPDLEREKYYLLRFIGEIEAAEHLLFQARQAAREIPAARVWFDYDQLNSDLQLIASGIEDYLHRSGAGQPRHFSSHPMPLSGDYQTGQKDE